MIIRTAPKPVDEQAVENCFVAVDELENPLGSLSLTPRVNDTLMPDRPLEFLLRVHGKSVAAHALLGAGLSRGMLLAQEDGRSARIYAECGPEEGEKLQVLQDLGFVCDDALVRMRRMVVDGPNIARLPEGLVLVEDQLQDDAERRFVLEREEKLFLREHAEDWLMKLEKMSGFTRLLLAGRTGLAGELLLYETGRTGVIMQVYTAPSWRRMGVALHLMECARQRFAQDRMEEALLDVRLRNRAAYALCSAAGFRQSETLRRLPGIDMN